MKVQCHGQEKTDTVRNTTKTNITRTKKGAHAWASPQGCDLLPISETLWGLSCKKSLENSPLIFKVWLVYILWANDLERKSLTNFQSLKRQGKGEKFLWLLGLSEAIIHVTALLKGQTLSLLTNSFTDKFNRNLICLKVMFQSRTPTQLDHFQDRKFQAIFERIFYLPSLNFTRSTTDSDSFKTI